MKMLRTREPIKTTSHLLGGILTELLKQKQPLGIIGFGLESGCFRCSFGVGHDSLPWHVAIVNQSRSCFVLGVIFGDCYTKSITEYLEALLGRGLG